MCQSDLIPSTNLFLSQVVTAQGWTQEILAAFTFHEPFSTFNIVNLNMEIIKECKWIKSWPPCKSGQSLSSPERAVVVCTTPPLYSQPPKPLVKRFIGLRKKLFFFHCTAHYPNLIKHLSALQKKGTRDRFETRETTQETSISASTTYQKKIQLQLTSIGEE